MKRTICHVCSALAVIGMLATSFALAEEKGTSPGLDPKMEEMMKKAETAGKPGPHHKKLDPLVGEWNAEVKSWMTPGAPPVVTKGTAKSNWVMNGRFVQEEFTGDFFGKPFHGMSLLGYDNTKQKYQMSWVDDASTSMFTSEGEAGENGKTLTFEGKYACPVTGRKDTPMKQVLTILSEDKHLFEMHDLSKGENSKTMEITYTRK